MDNNVALGGHVGGGGRGYNGVSGKGKNRIKTKLFFKTHRKG